MDPGDGDAVSAIVNRDRRAVRAEGGGNMSLLAVARRVIESSLRGGSAAAVLDGPALLAVGPAQLSELAYASRQEVDTARLMSMVRMNRQGDARRLADEMRASWPDARDRGLAPEIPLARFVALSEAYAAFAETLHALEYASLAMRLSEEVPDPRWQLRVLGVGAAANALNGEWAIAEDLLARRSELAAQRGWSPQDTGYSEAVAGLLLAFACTDGQRARSIAVQLRSLADTEPVAAPLGDLAESVALAMQGENAHAIDLATRTAQGIPLLIGTELVREFAWYLLGYLYLCEREPVRAEGIVRGKSVLGNHLLCPNVILAVAALQRQDYREVLAVSSECIRGRARHSRWSLPLILLVRACAHLRLGNPAAALREGGAAFVGGGIEHFSAALRIVPLHDVGPLLDASDRVFPLLRRQTAIYRVQVSRSALDSKTSPGLPRLTKREQKIAGMLSSRLSFPEIARRLHVSTGTVKSQASSIYRKLGVVNRGDAVDMLNLAGYYEGAEAVP
ncbi:LuxR C-terminal-related transcriptional regulator [Microbacterium sp. NPDC089698]|uniref:helix-turn-helix transcriptional regulator n=1 Tax=Microbacterium sp. NPDC089698 TaxID=3364200 RepID=UPI003822F8AF